MHRSIYRTACSLTILFTAAALTPVFAQSSKIAQTEVKLEPAAPHPTAHDQFGFVTAMSANGQTLAIGATTTDQGVISEDGAVLICDRVQGNWVQTPGSSLATAPTMSSPRLTLP